MHPWRTLATYPPRMAKRPANAPTLDAKVRVLILHGKDRFRQGEHLATLRAALEEAHGDSDAVDVIRFDGTTDTVADILDECRSYGLMQQHKLVIIEAADQLVKASDDAPSGRGHVTARQALESYTETPSECATLVLRADTWRPGKLDKAVAKVGATLKCEPLSLREAVSWARDRAGHHKTSLSSQAATLLIDHIGPDLGRIDSELAKLSTGLEPGTPIDPDQVRAHVGVTREEEFWSIQEALLTGPPERALHQLRDLIEISRHDPVAITWSYVDLARKLAAAARMLAEGGRPPAIAKNLRLWGPAGDALIGAAKRLGPARAASLLEQAIEADAKHKSGRAEPGRSLECLTVGFTSNGR